MPQKGMIQTNSKNPTNEPDARNRLIHEVTASSMSDPVKQKLIKDITDDNLAKFEQDEVSAILGV